VAISKVERLMNLVIALLSTRNFITAERIRETVSGYSDNASDEAFSRMFERDKNELRDLGIPLETGRVSQFDPTEGYRINREAYALPAVELTADEAAAVAVATQLWESPELITATQGALLKLRAAGVDVDAPHTDVAIASTAALPSMRGSEGRVLEQLSSLLAPDGLLVAGFSLKPAGLTLEQYDRLAETAGLRKVNRWATWDRQPYDGGNYAVSVHRRLT
jgi:predicted DNA-binding transcriptional regulator YafY